MSSGAVECRIKPPAPPQEVVESEASQPGGSKPGGPQAQTQTEAQRAAYYHDDVEDDTEASAALLQSQQLQMDDQDAQLDLLGHSIQRQQHLSLQMNEELGRQYVPFSPFHSSSFSSSFSSSSHRVFLSMILTLPLDLPARNCWMTWMERWTTQHQTLVPPTED